MRVELAFRHHREHARHDLDQQIVRRDFHDLRNELVAFPELVGMLDPWIGQRMLEGK